MTALLARIILRYPAGLLLGLWGMPDWMIDRIREDPEVAGVVACGITGGVEGCYWLAKKFGWRT